MTKQAEFEYIIDTLIRHAQGNQRLIAEVLRLEKEVAELEAKLENSEIQRRELENRQSVQSVQDY